MSSGIVRIRKGTRDEALFGAELQHFINQRSSTRYELTQIAPLASADPELLSEFTEAFSWDVDSREERLRETGSWLKTI